MSYEVKIGSEVVYRFRTVEEAKWYFQHSAHAMGPVWSRKGASHYLSWGEGETETSKKGKLPPRGSHLAVKDLAGVVVRNLEKKTPKPKRYHVTWVGLMFKTREEAEAYVRIKGLYRTPEILEEEGEPEHQLVWGDGRTTYGSGKGLLPPPDVKNISHDLLRGQTLPKLVLDPKVLSRSYQVGSFAFKTKEEAEVFARYHPILVDGAIQGWRETKPLSQLVWKEGDMVYGSAEGLLPPSEVEGIWWTSFKDRQDLRVTREKPKSYRVGNMRFRTQKEADYYRKFVAPKLMPLNEEWIEPLHQLVWEEGDKLYGSAEGLLPIRSSRFVHIVGIDRKEQGQRVLHFERKKASAKRGSKTTSKRASKSEEVVSKEPTQSEETAEGFTETSEGKVTDLGVERPSSEGLDYLPYLLETDLRTPEDVLNWLIEYPGTDAAQASIDLHERLKRERGQALLRAAAQVVVSHRSVEQLEKEAAGDIATSEESSTFAASVEDADIACGGEADSEASSEPSAGEPSAGEPSAWMGAFGFLALLGLVGKRTTPNPVRKRIGVVNGTEADLWEPEADVVETATREFRL